MNRSDLDWHYLRRYTLRPAVCALLAGVTLIGALWQHGVHEERFTQLTANQNALHEDYNSLVEQRRIVDRYHRRYQQFFTLGFIGKESRLDWVETMRTASNELNLPRLSYSIEPQLGVVAPITSVVGNDILQVRVSKVQLEMGLLHEVDLLKFFDVLQRQAPGLISVDQCELELIRIDGRAGAEENLTATCGIRVFSVMTSDISGESV